MLSQGFPVELLDGDLIRAQFSPGLGFSRQDREANLRRIALMADQHANQGVTVIISSIAPYRDLRNEFRQQLTPFLEVFVNAPPDVCEQRDVKGLYRRYRAGELKGLTGIDDVYEPPLAPDLECATHLETIEESTGKILDAIRRHHRTGSTQSSESTASHELQPIAKP
jgi:adenylylsulfate kinase